MIKKIVFRQLNTLSISLLKILLEDFDIRTHEKFMFQKNVGWELHFDRYQYRDYSSLSKEGKSVDPEIFKNEPQLHISSFVSWLVSNWKESN